MKKQTATLLIIIIFLFAFTIRLQGLGEKITTPVEYYTMDHFGEGKDFFKSISKLEVTPPLFFLIAQIALFVSRIETVYMVQLISVIAGSLTSILVFFISKETIGEKKAFVAMALFAIYPTSVLYSQHARAYALVTLLTMISTYYFITWIKKGKGYLRFSLANLFLIYTHYLTFTLILAQTILGIVERKKYGVNLKKLIGSLVFVLILSIPLTLLISEQIPIHKEVTLEIETKVPLIDQRRNQALFGIPLIFLSQAVQVPTGIWFCDSGGIFICFRTHIVAPTLVFLAIAIIILGFALKGFLKLSNENKKIFGLTYFFPILMVSAIVSTSFLGFATNWVVMFSPLLTIFIANEADTPVKLFIIISGWVIVLTYYFFAVQSFGIIGAGII